MIKTLRILLPCPTLSTPSRPGKTHRKFTLETYTVYPHNFYGPLSCVAGHTVCVSIRSPLSASHTDPWCLAGSGCCGDGYPVLLVYAGTSDRGTFGWNGVMIAVGFWSLDRTTSIATTPSTTTAIPPIAIPAMAPIGIPVGPLADTVGVIILTEGVKVVGLDILELEEEDGSCSLKVVVGIGPFAGLVSSRYSVHKSLVIKCRLLELSQPSRRRVPRPYPYAMFTEPQLLYTLPL